MFLFPCPSSLQTGGQLNTTLFKLIYALVSVTVLVMGLLSWPGSVMLSEVSRGMMETATTVQEYPRNTVRGRVCLGLRLDWDRDGSKATSDIYLKPRLIVLASTTCFMLYLLYVIFRTRRFVHGFLGGNRSHASIGGRYLGGPGP